MAQFSLTEIFILSKESVFGYNVRKAEIIYVIYPENIFKPHRYTFLCSQHL